MCIHDSSASSWSRTSTEAYMFMKGSSFVEALFKSLNLSSIQTLSRVQEREAEPRKGEKQIQQAHTT